MPVVCPNCDVAPPPDATTGGPCPACKTALIGVKDAEDLVGTVIDDRFEIVARLGKGGMGTVYRANQRSIGREVALKLIDRRFEDDVIAVKRFLREAKLASALAHPNTVGVIEFGQSRDGRLYLAMELVRGKTLLDVTHASGGLPLARIVRIGVQLCDALEAAHALAIVHRDLKLENVMLLDGPKDRDLVKVLDFGLARSLVDVDSRATATGMIAGTPRYLPPEVALAGADPAPAQDLYSLGVLLGELSTGSPLWDAPTLEALFTAKVHGAPKLDRVPAGLRKLVEQLLATEAELRPDAAATRTALLALREPGAGEPRSAGPPLTSPLALEATRALEPPPPPRVVAPPPPQPPPLLRVDDSAERAPPASAAFAPPVAAGDQLELETEWVRGKAEKRAAASRPAPKPRLKIWGIVLAVAAVGIVAVVVVIIARAPPETSTPLKSTPHGQQLPATANTVSVEIRTKPAAPVTFDGHNAGRSPVTLHIPRSTKSVEIGAVLLGHPLTRTVIPDHDQTVDLTYP